MIDYKKEELILSVKNVSLDYGDGKMILRDVNFDVHNITRPEMTQGQVIAICGKSGSGKSSLFKILSGFSKPTEGRVSIDLDQHDVVVGEVGMVPQDYPLFNHRTIYENLALALKQKDSKNQGPTIKEYSEYFGLSDHLEKYPSELSGGQRQRVSILQQVLAGNRFILMDEPFSGLDVIMKDKVIELILKVSNLNEYNTLIIVSHDIESSCAISDTVYVLSPTGEMSGSTISKTYDLLAEGLAYSPGIKENQRFQEIIKEIKSII
jgi:ABC-type nitrate/sulfonate/bicarbonate transport system ATPase subunit